MKTMQVIKTDRSAKEFPSRWRGLASLTPLWFPCRCVAQRTAAGCAADSAAAPGGGYGGLNNRRYAAIFTYSKSPGLLSMPTRGGAIQLANLLGSTT